MKVVAIVPIKLNNERTPGKNLKQFSDGETLLGHSLKKLDRVQSIDEIYVFCSRPEVQEYIPQSCNKVKYFRRSEYLDSPEARPQDIMREALDGLSADIYVFYHVTTPFISEDSIADCIEHVKSGEYDSAQCVRRVGDFLWMGDKPINFDPASISRTQNLPEIVKETTGIYVFRREVFDETNQRVGKHPYRHYVGSIEDLDIDYPEDWEIAYAMYEHLVANDSFRGG